MTDSIVRAMWKFMTEHNVKIEDTTPTVPALREDDSPLMEDFMKNKSIPSTEYKTLNKC